MDKRGLAVIKFFWSDKSEVRDSNLSTPIRSFFTLFLLHSLGFRKVLWKKFCGKQENRSLFITKQ